MNKFANNGNVNSGRGGIPDERAFRLMEALNGVDEELLERSEEEAGSGKIVWLDAFRRNTSKYGKTCAAALCFVVVGLLAWGGLRVVEDNFPMGAADNATGAAMYGGMNTTPSGSMALYSSSENLEVTTKETSPMPRPESAVDANDTEESGGKDAGDTTNAIVENEEKSNLEAKSDGVSGTALNSARKITLEEARALEQLGAYIPEKLPEGYVLESVHCDEEGSKSLSLCWINGMDSIFWSIQVVEDVSAFEVVDLTKEETYNEFLYQTPLSETLPEEYREIFQNPVCKAEEFCLDFVEKRMIFRGEDTGDTTTPRGNFGVLYPEGVLVQFNGRGAAGDIYEMFEGLKQ